MQSCSTFRENSIDRLPSLQVLLRSVGYKHKIPFKSAIMATCKGFSFPIASRPSARSLPARTALIGPIRATYALVADGQLTP